MTINEVVQGIRQDISEEILCVCGTGSSTFCTDCKDIDIWVITKDGNEYGKIRGYDGYDIFVWSLSNLENAAKQFEYKSLYILSLFKGEILYGDNPLGNFDFFAHKQEIIETIKRECEERHLSAWFENGQNAEMCLKQSIWLLANYFAIVNNSFDFTDEQTEILQKCHDNKLPRSYLQKIYDEMQSI